MLDERPLAAVLARSAVLAAIVLIVTIPVYVWVEPTWRALVARLACAFVLGVALLQLRAALSATLEAGGASALDAARSRQAPEASVPYHFQDLVSDVRMALRSRSYFERALWPRLEALAARPLVRPRMRPGRGPSLAGLRRVLDTIDRRP